MSHGQSENLYTPESAELGFFSSDMLLKIFYYNNSTVCPNSLRRLWLGLTHPWDHVSEFSATDILSQDLVPSRSLSLQLACTL